MKRLLILTFDLIRDCDPSISLAAGYLLSRLKADPAFGKDFTFKHVSFNLLLDRRITAKTAMDRICESVDLHETDCIAISCYVWCDYLVNDLVSGLRDRGFSGALVLGGYQIYPGDEVLDTYPNADFYISGYAEEALISILTSGAALQRRNLVLEPRLDHLPSPYLDNTILIAGERFKVRLETKRGCPFTCSFCGHRDLCCGKVYYHPVNKVKQELRHLAEKRPQKINIIDPVYNFGPHYLAILDFCLNDLNLDILLSLQVGAELLHGKNGDRFLEYCQALNSILEIGVESIHQNELAILNKKVDINHTKTLFKRLRDMQITFETNLIYGLPDQTRYSFKQSIQWLQDHGCEHIKCYPLMLLPGTPLYEKASSFGLETEPQGPLHLPIVVRSNTFDIEDWHSMDELARITTRGDEGSLQDGLFRAD